MTAARQLTALAIHRMEQGTKEYSLNSLYDFFAMAAAENHVHLFQEQQQEVLLEHGQQAIRSYEKSQRRHRDYEPRFSIAEHAPSQMKEQLLRLYCGGYNTLVDSAISWIEPTDSAKWDAIDALEEAGCQV